MIELFIVPSQWLLLNPGYQDFFRSDAAIVSGKAAIEIPIPFPIPLTIVA